MSTLIELIATLVVAIHNCQQTNNVEWLARHTATLENLARERLPSGSGFDSGSTVDLDRSSGQTIRINTAFHHMDEHGGYDGWTHHVVTIRANLAHGFTVHVSGRDRNGIKDYIADAFSAALTQMVTK